MTNARTRNETNLDGDTFGDWLMDLDRVLLATAGVTHSDLADFQSWNAWQDCREVDEVAEELLEDEGFPFDYTPTTADARTAFAAESDTAQLQAFESERSAPWLR